MMRLSEFNVIKIETQVECIANGGYFRRLIIHRRGWERDKLPRMEIVLFADPTISPDVALKITEIPAQ